jgi:hypothetical protein
LRGGRADDNDPARFTGPDHRSRRGLADEEDALEIGVDDPVPFRLGHLEEWRVGVETGVCDGDTRSTHLVLDRGDERRYRADIANIRHVPAAGDRFLAEPLTGCLDPIFHQIVEGDCRATAAEGVGDGEPQTRCGAGDECDLAAEIKLDGHRGS